MRGDLVTWCVQNSDLQFSIVRPEVHTLRYEVHTLRYQTVETFVLSGTPLKRLHFCKPQIEHSNVVSLVDVGHMKM